MQQQVFPQLQKENPIKTILCPAGVKDATDYYQNPPQPQGLKRYIAMARSISAENYERLMDNNWRRAGDLFYKPDPLKSSSLLLTIKLEATEFVPSKQQRRVVRKMAKFINQTENEQDVLEIKEKMEKNDEFKEKQQKNDKILGAKAIETVCNCLKQKLKDFLLALNLELESSKNSAAFKLFSLRLQKQNSKIEKFGEFYSDFPIKFFNFLKTCQISCKIPSPDELSCSMASFLTKQMIQFPTTFDLFDKIQGSNIGIINFKLKESLRTKLFSDSEIQTLYGPNSIQKQHNITPKADPNLENNDFEMEEKDVPQIPKFSVEIWDPKQYSREQMSEVFTLYQIYQKEIQKDSDTNLKSFKRFLVESPIEVPIPSFGSKNYTNLLACSKDTNLKSKDSISKTSRDRDLKEERDQTKNPESSMFDLIPGISFADFDKSIKKSPQSPLENPPLPIYGTFHFHYKFKGQLFMVGVVDIVPHGVSSVFCFYDPKFSFLSPGTFSVLYELNWILNFSHQNPSECQDFKNYYLGYYVDSCPKMKYKASFKPSLILCPMTHKWVPFDDPAIRKRIERQSLVSKLPHLRKLDFCAKKNKISIPEAGADAAWNSNLDLEREINEFNVCWAFYLKGKFRDLSMNFNFRHDTRTPERLKEFRKVIPDLENLEIGLDYLKNQ